MTQFFALLRLQLLSRFADWKPRNVKTAIGDKKGKAVMRSLGYIVLMLYLAGILVFLENTILTVLIRMKMPELLLTLSVLMSMLSTLVLAFFFILSTLYFDRDAAFTASLPVRSRTVLWAKMTQVWLSETLVSALFILPAGILYGIRIHPEALFYVRMVLVWLTVALLPITIVALLSTVLIRFSALWKRREIVATVGGIVLLVAYMLLCAQIGGITGSDNAEEFLQTFLTNNSARIEAITGMFPPAAWAAKGWMGDWKLLALFMLAGCAAFAAGVYLIGFRYHDLSLLQSETAGSTGRKAGKGRVSFASGSAFKACCVREIRQILRVPAYAVNLLPTSFMPVLMVGVMALSMNQAMRENGETLTQMFSGMNGGVIVAVMTALMSFMAGMNPALSTAVTREGKGHAAMTALPLTARTPVLAKLAVGMGLSVLGCIPAVAILIVLLPAYAVHAVLAFVATVLFCMAAGCMSLASDVAHPKLDWLTETEAVKQKSGSLMGLLISWGLLGVLGGASYLLLSTGCSMYVYAIALIGFLAVLSLLAARHLLRTADAKYQLN